MSIGSLFSAVGGLVKSAAPVLAAFNPAAGAVAYGVGELAGSLPSAASSVGSLFRRGDAGSALAVVTGHINRFTKSVNQQKGNR